MAINPTLFDCFIFVLWSLLDRNNSIRKKCGRILTEHIQKHIFMYLHTEISN